MAIVLKDGLEFEASKHVLWSFITPPGSLPVASKANKKILGIFLFGTDRVAEFIEKGFAFFSIGNDLHHLLTQVTTQGPT